MTDDGDDDSNVNRMTDAPARRALEGNRSIADRSTSNCSPGNRPAGIRSILTAWPTIVRPAIARPTIGRQAIARSTPARPTGAGSAGSRSTDDRQTGRRSTLLPACVRAAPRPRVEWRTRPRRALRRSGRIVPDTTHKNMTDDITTPPPSSAARPLPSFGPLRWIVRHWRGDYSLGIAFWLNQSPIYALRTICSQVLMTRVFERLGEGQGPGDNDAIASALAAVPPVVLADVALSLLNVWWVVGVWRAARRHIARTGRRFWARAAQVTAALVAARIAYSIVVIPHSIETLQLLVIDPGRLLTDPVGTLKNWLF
nr:MULTISPECIES: hypothetical protein [unclassified Burkholderia]